MTLYTIILDDVLSFGCGATAEEGEDEVEDELGNGERVGAVGAL